MLKKLFKRDKDGFVRNGSHMGVHFNVFKEGKKYYAVVYTENIVRTSGRNSIAEAIERARINIEKELELVTI